MHKKYRFQTLLALFTGLFCTAQVLAQNESDMTDFGTRAPSSAELISALQPSPALAFRSTGPQQPPKPKAVSLRIEFLFDSNALTEDAQNTLNQVGGALTTEALAKYRFRIEGHTDASGNKAYNQTLSERRAESVKNYLVNVFNVSPDRLQELGLGEQKLLYPDNPDDSANRRVQITNLGE